MHLSRFRVIADSLFEFRLSRIESANHHEITAKNLVSLGVPEVELQGFRQSLNRRAQLLLRKQGVAVRIPAPRRLWVLDDVAGKHRLDFLEFLLPDVAFDLGEL